MGFFDSIKNAFHHPIDVNIKSSLTFKASDTVIPIELEIINKEPEKQYVINEIVILLTKTLEERQDNSPASPREMFRESQQVNIILSDGSPKYLNLEAHNTSASFVAEAAQRVLPDNALVNGLLNFAGKAEQFANVMDSKKDYTYRLRVELYDQDGMRGYDEQIVNILSPGEVSGLTNVFHT